MVCVYVCIAPAIPCQQSWDAKAQTHKITTCVCVCVRVCVCASSTGVVVRWQVRTTFTVTSVSVVGTGASCCAVTTALCHCTLRVSDSHLKTWRRLRSGEWSHHFLH